MPGPILKRTSTMQQPKGNPPMSELMDIEGNPLPPEKVEQVLKHWNPPEPPKAPAGPPVYDLTTVLDADGTASSLLLRDIHAALLRCIDGFSLKRLPEVPEVAKLVPDDAKAENWQERTWMCILNPSAPQDIISQEARVSGSVGCCLIAVVQNA